MDAKSNVLIYLVLHLSVLQNRRKVGVGVKYVLKKCCVGTTQSFNWRPSGLKDSWMGLSYHLPSLDYGSL